ncbi:MAG TPA: HAMP domain-containing sensor histidine kinase [Myxococcota bacterium]|nr:HAMP domain-containing sensor histidine kinase [Myxococcota bacterium]
MLVLDDGQGIGRDEQPRILDPFFTTKRSSGRAGLGLSVVHGIVAEHRGTLEIEPGAGGGTRATLTLPSVDRVEDGARRTGATEPGRA